MHAKVISKDEMVGLLDELIKRYDVFAPVLSDDVVLFDRIVSGGEAILDFANSKLNSIPV